MFSIWWENNNFLYYELLKHSLYIRWEFGMGVVDKTHSEFANALPLLIVFKLFCHIN